MGGVGGKMSGLFENFELLVVVKARTIDDAFEFVEGVEIFIIAGGGGFGMDIFEKLFAEFGEANWSAVIWLAFFVKTHERTEVFGADLLPVVLVIAAGDGEDLDFATIFRNERENAVDVEVGVVEGGGDVAEEGFEFGAADFVFFEEGEEGLFLLGGDFDEVGGDEDLGIVAAGEIGDDLGLALLGGDDGVIGESGGGDWVGSCGCGSRRGGDVLELVEALGELRRKFV